MAEGTSDRGVDGGGGVTNQRIAVITAPRTVQVYESRLREPTTNEVLVRVGGCGVCGSNEPIWDGRPWFEYPLPPGAPGHEAWGEIEAVGAGVEGQRVGDAV